MGLIWQYIVVFAMAATPWLEILIVIPIGIGWGLGAIPVAIVSFLGNIVPILIIIVVFERLQSWWENRRKLKASEDSEASGESTQKKESSRSKRGKEIMEKYGLPGLSLAGPILTGVHLATVVALGLGMNKRAVALWMTLSLAIWTILITLGTYYSFEGLRWLLGSS